MIKAVQDQIEAVSRRASCKNNDIETGRGTWKSLAAAPMGVGTMRYQVEPGRHLK